MLLFAYWATDFGGVTGGFWWTTSSASELQKKKKGKTQLHSSEKQQWGANVIGIQSHKSWNAIIWPHTWVKQVSRGSPGPGCSKLARGLQPPRPLPYSFHSSLPHQSDIAVRMRTTPPSLKLFPACQAVLLRLPLARATSLRSRCVTCVSDPQAGLLVDHSLLNVRLR